MLPSALLWQHSHIIILLPYGWSSHKLLSIVTADLRRKDIAWIKNPLYPTNQVAIFTRLSVLSFLPRRSIAILRWGVKSSIVRRYSQRLSSQPIMVYPSFLSAGTPPDIYTARTITVPSIVYTENVKFETERLIKEGWPVSPLGVIVTDAISDIIMAPSYFNIYITNIRFQRMGHVLMRCSSRRVGLLVDPATTEQVLRTSSAATINYRRWKQDSGNLTT